MNKMKTGIHINIEIRYLRPKPDAWIKYDISALTNFIDSFVSSSGATMTGGIVVIADEEDENED